MSPFYANYGYHGRTNWSKEGEAKNPASELYAHWMESVHKKAKENLEAARSRREQINHRTAHHR